MTNFYVMRLHASSKDSTYEIIFVTSRKNIYLFENSLIICIFAND